MIGQSTVEVSSPPASKIMPDRRGHGEKLTRNKEKAIAALMEESTIEMAAKRVGINERTLRVWLKLPGFQSEYRAARRRVLEVAIGKLQQASGDAVDTLHRNLNCDHASTEVRAAVAILDQSIKAIELMDLDQRLTNIESTLQQ